MFTVSQIREALNQNFSIQATGGGSSKEQDRDRAIDSIEWTAISDSDIKEAIDEKQTLEEIIAFLAEAKADFGDCTDICFECYMH